MSGLGNTMDRAGGWISGKGYMTSKERRAIAKDKSQAKLDKVYAGADMPDSELIRRNERRKAAGRRGSRMRNVLTEDLLG